MNHDEFAFLNQQLAAMLREGIPLEGAIRRLCKEAGRGRSRAAFLKVEEQLKQGAPLDEAVAKAKLPKLYSEMVRLGVASGDLPATLTLAADYYRKTGAIWTRLRALLTYPLIVLLLSLAMSVWFAVVYHKLNGDLAPHLQAGQDALKWMSGREPQPMEYHWWLNVWMPPALIVAACVVFVGAMALPAVRSRIRWSVGPFRDASLAQLAAAMHLLLRKGVALRESLAFVAAMESANRAGRDLQRWTERHAEGHARFSEVAAGSIAVPSLFIWIVSSAGEDLASGFGQAAELYGERARRRAELLLNLVLPCALLALGLMIMGQIEPFLTSVFDVFTPIFKTQQILGGINQ